MIDFVPVAFSPCYAPVMFPFPFLFRSAFVCLSFMLIAVAIFRSVTNPQSSLVSRPFHVVSRLLFCCRIGLIFALHTRILHLPRYHTRCRPKLHSSHSSSGFNANLNKVQIVTVLTVARISMISAAWEWLEEWSDLVALGWDVLLSVDHPRKTSRENISSDRSNKLKIGLTRRALQAEGAWKILSRNDAHRTSCNMFSYMTPAAGDGGAHVSEDTPEAPTSSTIIM